MKKYPKQIIKLANSVARKGGYGFATEIVFGNENKIISHINYGYRKYTTGEYVSNAYRHNFGWKNTYYQNSETTIMLNCDDNIVKKYLKIENIK